MSDELANPMTQPTFLSVLLDRSRLLHCVTCILCPANSTLESVFVAFLANITATGLQFGQEEGSHPDLEFVINLMTKFIAAEMPDLIENSNDPTLYTFQVMDIETNMYARTADVDTMLGPGFTNTDEIQVVTSFTVVDEETSSLFTDGANGEDDEGIDLADFIVQDELAAHNLVYEEYFSDDSDSDYEPPANH